MKYLIILISILLVSCGVNKSKLIQEPTSVDKSIGSDTDSLGSMVEPDRLMISSPNLNTEIIKLELGKTELVKKYPKLKIINIKNSILKTTTNKGHVAYHIPNTMNVRDTYQVSLRISKTTVNIFEELEGVVKTTIIPITETMEVKLIDPSPIDDKMFSIVPDNNAEQLIEDGNEVTNWTWNVTPLKTGKANLKIVVSIIKNGYKKETVYQDNIRVKTNPVKTIPLFFSKYWQWMLSTLIIPFGVWLYNRRKKE